jgi:hypothetical protein
MNLDELKRLEQTYYEATSLSMLIAEFDTASNKLRGTRITGRIASLQIVVGPQNESVSIGAPMFRRHADTGRVGDLLDEAFGRCFHSAVQDYLIEARRILGDELAKIPSPLPAEVAA